MHSLTMLLVLSTVGANDFTVTTLGSGAAANAATTTSSDVTLAVSATGSDTGGQPAVITGGDYSSMPFATIQAAIDALPDLVCNDVTITAGVGTFAGALVSKQGCASSPDNYPWIRIHGTRAVATLASGSVSGTATSGGTSTLTLTGAGWTVDDLQGRILYVTAGTGDGEYVVATNTTDTITIASVVTFDATSVFQLEDLATVINTTRAGYSGGNVFEVQNNSTNVWLRDMRVTYSDADANGVLVSHASAIGQRVVVDVTSSYDGFKVTTDGVLTTMDCGFLGTTSNAGFSSYGESAILYYYGIMADSSSDGIRSVYGGVLTASGTGGFWVEAVSDGIRLDDCNKTARVNLHNGHVEGAQNGIYMDNCIATLDTVDIDGTTSKTIYAHESEIFVDTALTGTGNVWGFDFSQPGSSIHLSSTPTITGLSGDATSDGTTAVTWASVVDGSPGMVLSGDVRSEGSLYIGPEALASDFSGARVIISDGNSGLSDSRSFGMVVESKASGTGATGYGMMAVGATDGADYGIGLVGRGKTTDTTDTGDAIGVQAIGLGFHSGGRNIGLYAQAGLGAENYAIYIHAGDILQNIAQDWDLPDEEPNALSFDTPGLAGMLEFDTSDGAERLRTSVPLFQFGGTSATEVALKPNGTEMQLRLADDSGWGNLQAGAMTLNGALDMTGNLISDSTGAVQHGTAGTPDKVGVGDDYFGGDVEVDGTIYADNGVTSPNGSPLAAGNMRINNNSVRFASGPNIIYSVDRTGAESSKAISLYTGDASNAGDYASGDLNFYTGDTTTDGNTGTISIYTGVAGVGTADAGDILMAVHGAPGAGTDVFQATGSAGAITMAKLKQEDAAATCTVGEVVLDNAATIELCYCQATNTWYCVALAAGPAD